MSKQREDGMADVSKIGIGDLVWTNYSTAPYCVVSVLDDCLDAWQAHTGTDGMTTVPKCAVVNVLTADEMRDFTLYTAANLTLEAKRVGVLLDDACKFVNQRTEPDKPVIDCDKLRNHMDQARDNVTLASRPPDKPFTPLEQIEGTNGFDSSSSACCRTCRWFCPDDGPKDWPMGCCRRNPPIVGDRPWPLMSNDCWCGEWARFRGVNFKGHPCR